MKRKVLICEFSQESNSFNPLIWDIKRFKSMVVCGGFKMKVIYNLLKSPVKGMAKAVKENGARPVYGFAMRAASGGPVSDDSVGLFLEKTRNLINENDPFDAVLLSLHGATISETEEDVCGFITEKVRQYTGGNAVIGLACDMHANVTERMQKNADYICGFQTYPHVDVYETGYRASSLVMNRLGGGRSEQIYYKIPMMVPASGYTSSEGVFGDIIQKGHDFVASGKAEDFSVFMMQPWLDVKETASYVSVVSNDAEAAGQEAEKLGRLLFEGRKEFWPETTPVEKVIEAAGRNTDGKPIILAEPSDSPNGGAVGDSVAVLHKLTERERNIKALTFVTDPEAVKEAVETGQGNRRLFKLGAKFTPDMGEPVEITCRVKSLHKGKFRMAGPMGKGMVIDIGKTAVLSYGNTDIMVCEMPGGTGDVNFYKGFGLNPADYDLVVVKANTSFRASYKGIASKIFIADTYAAGSSNLTQLPFKIIDRENFYPFNENPAF